MAEKLLRLKSPKAKTAKKTIVVSDGGHVVIVGTYRTGQLDWIKKNGIYNYPVDEEECSKEKGSTMGKGGDLSALGESVKELWLYANVKAERYCFTAEFIGIQSRDEFLAANPTYRELGPSTHSHTRYMVFKTTFLDYGPKLEGTKVFARVRDFAGGRGRSRPIAGAIQRFHDDGEFGLLAAYLPTEVSRLPQERLRVCEAAVQLDFLECLGEREDSAALFCNKFVSEDVHIELGDSLGLCESWSPPTVIVSDGPYGLGSYPGDPATPEGLEEFYRPFLMKWYERALPSATLWFWNSEQGWANCHRMIENCGWEFRNCHIWNKGMSHVAGNCNTKTIRKYPVVTEVCAQYVRKNYLCSCGVNYRLKEWMRAEWQRTQLPFRLTNVACGVKDAATRKYFATDHLWYFPPAEAFVRIAAYANEHGAVEGRPYFTKPNGGAFSANEWELMRAKFHCEIGVSNVWNLPAVRGGERLKAGSSCLHMNQKPLQLLELIIRSSSDPGDVVWEPFGGLCSASVAALRTGRKAFASEINPHFFTTAKERIRYER